MVLQDALARLDGKSELGADDALAARRAIYGGGQPIGRADAEALFKLNADAGGLSPDWRQLFVEAMTDYVVRQSDPAGYIDDARAAWLIAQVKQAGRIREDEMEMLIHVLEEADQSPPALSTFALGLVKAYLLWRIRQGQPLAAPDVERLRRVIYAAGGEGDIAVTRHEAETLFDINDALDGAEADPAWTELFKRAVANAVLFETPWRPDRQAEVRREAWLADTHIHPLGRLAGVWSGATAGEMGQEAQALAHFDFQNHDLERAYAADQAMEAKAERLTEDEAHWLLQRIGRNGRIDANERALIAFIRDNARGSSDTVAELLAALERRQGLNAS